VAKVYAAYEAGEDLFGGIGGFSGHGSSSWQGHATVEAPFGRQSG
jgi:hypothetical protein